MSRKNRNVLVSPSLPSSLLILCLTLFGIGGISAKTCELIKIELCKGIGYNMTSMPNLVGHDMQTDVDLTLQTFSPLISYGCSAQLNFFLCSAYLPMCTTKVIAIECLSLITYKN
jgi:frizzled protein 4